MAAKVSVEESSKVAKENAKATNVKPVLPRQESDRVARLKCERELWRNLELVVESLKRSETKAERGAGCRRLQ